MAHQSLWTFNQQIIAFASIFCTHTHTMNTQSSSSGCCPVHCGKWEAKLHSRSSIDQKNDNLLSETPKWVCDCKDESCNSTACVHLMIIVPNQHGLIDQNLIQIDKSDFRVSTNTSDLNKDYKSHCFHHISDSKTRLCLFNGSVRKTLESCCLA